MLPPRPMESESEFQKDPSTVEFKTLIEPTDLEPFKFSLHQIFSLNDLGEA